MSKSWLRTDNEYNGIGPLFDAAARKTDPETSHMAAEHVREKSATKLEAEVLSALRRHPHGLTNHELVTATGIDWNTITPRIAPLKRKGLVYDSGERRKGSTNRECIVWRVSRCEQSDTATQPTEK